MVTKYGMSDKLGPINSQGKGEKTHRKLNVWRKYGDRIGQEVKLLIDTAYNDAQILLREHRDKLDEID